MPTQIPSLWPDNIDVDVVPPIAVLRHQASELRERTKGLLEAEVRSWPSKQEQGRIIHEFQIRAPALEGYTYSLFRIWHNKDFVYPAEIYFEPWVSQAKTEYFEKQKRLLPAQMFGPYAVADLEPSGIRSAATQTEFLEAMSDLLTSPRTKSVLMSLIARIKQAETGEEEQPPAQPPASTSAPDLLPKSPDPSTPAAPPAPKEMEGPGDPAST